MIISFASLCEVIVFIYGFDARTVYISNDIVLSPYDVANGTLRDSVSLLVFTFIQLSQIIMPELYAISRLYF